MRAAMLTLTAVATVAAATTSRCAPCDERVVVATTINGVRTASLLVPSAVHHRVPLRVYHENSADARAGKRGFDASTLPGCFRAACFAAYDLHELYPWLESFASRNESAPRATVFGRAYANALQRKPGALPKHARGLTVKAHFIFRKVLALRHAVEAAAASRVAEVAVWADADVALRRPLNSAAFLKFAKAHDIATIHRYAVPSRADAPDPDDGRRCDAVGAFFAPENAARALPDTGFASFAVHRGAESPALGVARAWSAYYATAAASASACLNDICVYDRVLFPQTGTAGDGLEALRARAPPAGAYRPPDAVASALAPPGVDPSALDRWVADYVYGGGAAAVDEGWYALCAEARPGTRHAAFSTLRGGDDLPAGAALSDGAIAAKYRVDLSRAHPCPSATPRTSPFHLFDYALHAKGGANKSSWRATDERRRLAATPDETAARAVSRRWKAFRKEALSHPYDADRVHLEGVLRAANTTRLPVGAIVEALRSSAAPPFYDRLERGNGSYGYPSTSLRGRRSTLDAGDRPLPGARSCGVDPEAVALQAALLHGGACGCEDAEPYLMEGTIGLGGELSALLKPFTASFAAGKLFRTPEFRRRGCAAPDMAACLGLRPLDRCGAVAAGKAAEPASARRFSRDVAGAPPPRYAHRGLFWWTAQSLAFLARPDDETLSRLWRTSANLDWRARSPVLGVHVRRGDTCLDGGANELRKHKGRTCEGLDAYAARARAMVAAHGFRSVFLATDDAAILEEAISSDAFGVPVLVANRNVDRAALYGAGYYNKVLKKLPESAANDDARAVLDDLLLLASADGLVGKATSNIFRLALALGSAWKGGDCLVPFESLDASWCADFGRLTGDSVHGAFLC